MADKYFYFSIIFQMLFTQSKLSNYSR